MAVQLEGRIGIAALVLSAAGLVGIVVEEGYSARAKPDPVRGTKVATLGYGSTQGVKMGDTTTPVAALQRMQRDVQVFEGSLKRCVHVPLYQYEYDAYINLTYNIGGSAFCGSTLVKKLNAQDYVGACNAILDWHKAGDVDCSVPGNEVCYGLWQRRLRLHRQCLGPAQP